MAWIVTSHLPTPPSDVRGYLTSRVLPGFALDPALLWADEYPRGAALARLIDAMQ